MTTQATKTKRDKFTEELWKIKIMNTQYLNIVCEDRSNGPVFINNKEVPKDEIFRFRLLSNKPKEGQSQLAKINIVGGPEETKKWLWDMHNKNYKLRYNFRSIREKFKNATGKKLEEKREWNNYLNLTSMADIMGAGDKENPQYPILLINDEAVRPVAEAILDYCYFYKEEMLKGRLFRESEYSFRYGRWEPNY